MMNPASPHYGTRPSETTSEMKAKYLGESLAPEHPRPLNINRDRAYLSGDFTAYVFPDGEEPLSTYNADHADFSGTRPSALVPQHKPDRAVLKFETRSLYEDSYQNASAAAKQAGRAESLKPKLYGTGGTQRMADLTTYRAAAVQTGARIFETKGWGAEDIPSAPTVKDDGEAMLITGRALNDADQKVVQQQRRLGVGLGLLGGSGRTSGTSQYQDEHGSGSRSGLLARTMNWNSRAEAHR